MPEQDISRDPQLFTAEERAAFIIELRRRILEKEVVSEDELRYGVRLIRLDRQASASRKPKGTKAAAPALSLADFANMGKPSIVE